MTNPQNRPPTTPPLLDFQDPATAAACRFLCSRSKAHQRTALVKALAESLIAAQVPLGTQLPTEKAVDCIRAVFRVFPPIQTNTGAEVLPPASVCTLIAGLFEAEHLSRKNPAPDAQPAP